jgi:hypothetical protein
MPEGPKGTDGSTVTKGTVVEKTKTEALERISRDDRFQSDISKL